MAEKREQSREELEEHLREQLGFLKSSCEAFDQGNEAEAKRLATTLRLLLHETVRSRSLLGQLGKLDGKFFDTAHPLNMKSLTSHCGLVAISYSPGGGRYVAGLDGVGQQRLVSFKTWWNAVVFLDQQRRAISRKDLVLSVADTDGGAHVDPALDAKYHALSRGNSMGWIIRDHAGERAMAGPERASIRQIAHELLKSIIPDYERNQIHNESISISGISVTPGTPGGGVEVAHSSKVRRNAPCPCGSGVKFKRCHGKPVGIGNNT